MSVTDQDSPAHHPHVELPALSRDAAEPDRRGVELPAQRKVSWLFSGVLLGLGTWLVVLAVIFAATGRWIVVAALLGGALLCGLAMWRADRRIQSDSR
jgi:hypothetical protein